MACGSCGARRGQAAGASRVLWVLKTEDGKTKTYATEAQARKVQGRLGGTVTSKKA